MSSDEGPPEEVAVKEVRSELFVDVAGCADGLELGTFPGMLELNGLAKVPTLVVEPEDKYPAVELMLPVIEPEDDFVFLWLNPYYFFTTVI